MSEKGLKRGGHHWIQISPPGVYAQSGKPAPAYGRCSCGEPEKSTREAAVKYGCDSTGTPVYTPKLYRQHVREAPRG